MGTVFCWLAVVGLGYWLYKYLTRKGSWATQSDDKPGITVSSDAASVEQQSADDNQPKV